MSKFKNVDMLTGELVSGHGCVDAVDENGVPLPKPNPWAKMTAIFLAIRESVDADVAQMRTQVSTLMGVPMSVDEFHARANAIASSHVYGYMNRNDRKGDLSIDLFTYGPIAYVTNEGTELAESRIHFEVMGLSGGKSGYDTALTINVTATPLPTPEDGLGAIYWNLRTPNADGSIRQMPCGCKCKVRGYYVGQALAIGTTPKEIASVVMENVKAVMANAIGATAKTVCSYQPQHNIDIVDGIDNVFTRTGKPTGKQVRAKI